MTDEVKKEATANAARPADYEMNLIHNDSSRVMLIATIVILIVALVGGVIAITPKVRKGAEQEEKIALLQQELAAVQAEREKAQAAETQLSGINEKMQMLAEQAKQFQNSLSTGEMQTRLNDLEGKFNQVVQQSHSLGLSGMVAKIQSIQQTPEGKTLVDNLVAHLANTPPGQDVGQNFETLRMSDPSVAQITEGVAPEDMKAAAMLIAMAQVRNSLQRNNDSFEEDLLLLKKTVPAEDVTLLAAIDRLAPQAKYGVLTSQGLSQELRGMTGDIVAASVSGQDVSIREKAKTRLANIFMVEKNGQQISGNETQIAIAAAQKELDKGNVQEAVRILETLNGPAAAQTQPFLEKAQATLMAGNLQTTISQSVVQNIKAAVSGLTNPLPTGVVNPNGFTNQIRNLMPAQQAAPVYSAPSTQTVQ